jgi:hypothetical protein
MSRDSLFISYARADEKWLARIRTMLSPLVRADRISLWDDTESDRGRNGVLKSKKRLHPPEWHCCS